MVHYRQVALLIALAFLAAAAFGQQADTLFVQGGGINISGNSLTIVGGSVTVRADSIRALDPNTWLVIHKAPAAIRHYRQTFSFPADSIVVPVDAVVISYSYSSTTKKVSGTWWRQK